MSLWRLLLYNIVGGFLLISGVGLIMVLRAYGRHLSNRFWAWRARD